MAQSRDDDARSTSAEDKLQKALQDATAKAAELSRSPIARSMLAAGLVTAAAALTANKKLRDNARKATRDAADGVDAAVENASGIGAAIVNAATEAVRKILGASAGGTPPSASSSRSAVSPNVATKRSAAKPAARAAGNRTKSPAKARQAKAAKPAIPAAVKTRKPTSTGGASKISKPGAKRTGAKSATSRTSKGGGKGKAG